MRFSACVHPTPERSHGEIRRAGVLSPYAAELLVEDALSAGPGARLEITVGNGQSLAEVRRQFAWLGRRGVEVAIRRAA
jgi:hypothetical protein